MAPKVKAFSFSRLGTFSKCEYQYAQLYIKRNWPTGSTVERESGIIAHEVAEAIALGRCEPKLSAAWELVGQLWEKKWHGELTDKRGHGEKWWRDHTMKCVSNFVRMGMPPPGALVIGVEKRMRVPMSVTPRYDFQGVIDRYYQQPDGSIEVEDFKTGKKQQEKWWLEDHQLPLYAKLVEKLHGVDPETPIIVRRLYLATGEPVQYKCSGARRQLAWEWAQQTAKRAEDFEARYRQTQRALTTKSPLCDWCAFKPVCPAFVATEEKTERQGGGVL